MACGRCDCGLLEFSGAIPLGEGFALSKLSREKIDMICGHCSEKHDAVRDVARCAWIAHAKTEEGISPAFKKAMEKRFPQKVEVKA